MEKFFDVTGKRELFIDDFLISSSRGIEFKAHPPVELPCHQGKENGDYVTIMKTPEGYNLYYRGVDSEYKGSRYNNHPGEFVGLLQSKDGLNWTAPELDRYPGKTVPRNTLFYGDEVITGDQRNCADMAVSGDSDFLSDGKKNEKENGCGQSVN